MNNRSVEILNNLKKHLERGTLSTQEFPYKDILDMIAAEYDEWLNNQRKYMNEYIQIYIALMENCIIVNDGDRMSGLLDELICDLRRTPDEALDRMDSLREALDNNFIETARRNAKVVYDHYPYQSTLGMAAFQGKGVIYTVITGNYDVLREPEYIDSAFDYICFTDNRELSSQVWNMRYVDNAEKLDNTRLARMHKILCHKFLKEYDYSIYIDGKLQIVGDLKEYVKKYSMGSSMLCFPHFLRGCVYEEAEACIAAGKDNSVIIRKQMNGYRQEGYPINNGLIDSACLVRRHDDSKLQSVLECWWKEVCEKSRRDQLSVGYACWKNDFHYDLCDLFVYQNEYFRKNREGEKTF